MVQIAMMWEIAVKAGNFRGVCPSKNRAAEKLCIGVYRYAGTEPACYVPVLFLS
jgi:hypothetical protein